jgi:Xaa-Pro aminopeptidase
MENFILKDENSIYYESNYSCDNAILLKLGSEKIFITDARYTVEAKNSTKDIEIVESVDLINSVKEILEKYSIKEVVFNPKEWTVFDFQKLDSLKNCTFKSKIDFHRLKRAIKSDREIELLRKACQIGRDCFNTFAKEIPNYERKDEKYLDFKFKNILSSYGEYDLSFNPIIAINENGAKPHSLPTIKELKSGDLLLVDAGIKYKRYCSDRTATSIYNENKINFDREQKFSDREIMKAYDLVRKAQEDTILKVRVGMKASEVDKIAREIIIGGGMGDYFIHSTGHGVGLDIHEYPFISTKSNTIIKDNMVFTVEPGVYFENRFGIRIEDMVVMKNGKAEIL